MYLSFFIVLVNTQDGSPRSVSVAERLYRYVTGVRFNHSVQLDV